MAIEKVFENSKVITKYNNKVYKIKKVNFSKNPETIFTKTEVVSGRKKVTKQSHAQYLAEKYYKTVTNLEQPLLETDNGLYLVPEFCFVTGLSDTCMHLPNKFGLVREVLNATKPDI